VRAIDADFQAEADPLRRRHRLGDLDAALFGETGHGPRDGMTERPPGGGHQAQDLVLRQRAVPHDAGHAQRADRERAGLVEDHRVDPREIFQNPRALDEDVVTVRAVDGAEDGGGDADPGGHAVVGHQDCGAGVEVP
jgi:hypothetical protein